MNPRKIAVDIVYSVLKNRHSLSDELATCRKKQKMTSLDIRFISELSSGVIRNLEYIDYHISTFSDIKINKIAPYVICVLRIGVYQLLFMDRIPASAAVNESVNIIKNSSNRRLSGFVNAVLRKIEKSHDEIVFPQDALTRLSVIYSIPQWIIELWSASAVNVEELAASMNKKPETTLRVNKLKTNRDELVKELTKSGWKCSKYNSKIFPQIDYLVTAHKISDIENTEAYKDGLFYIQDYAGAYVAEVLNPASGDIVFDMCASPGGKTTHLAEKMNNKGKIFAFDVSETKVLKIKENANRLGLTCIYPQVRDSRIVDSNLKLVADCILVDAPCSGLGIIRKKPDIKYLRTEEDSKTLSEISLEILNVAASYLKHGGRLVFSTCTTVFEENEAVLFEFLKNNPDFSLKKIDCAKDNEGFITLYPHIDNCDGFFIALMTKE